MADTLREVAQEAVAKVEGAPPPNKITDHGAQVAGVLKAEADKDVFTTLQIAAGEQVSPAILRANLDVSIGILQKDGSIDHTGVGYQGRYDRAVDAIKRVETYFSDQLDFADFLATTEGQNVVTSTGKFLMTHPALTEYFALVPTGDRVTAAKALAEKYLQDPYAREKVRQALLESAINRGEVADEFSEIQVKATSLKDKSTKLTSDISAIEAEIVVIKKRRAEFDKNPDLTKPKTLGTEYKDIEAARTKIAAHEAVIAGHRASIATLTSEVQKSERQWTNLKGDPDRTRVAGEIDDKNDKIKEFMEKIADEERKKAAEQMKVDAGRGEREDLDDKLRIKLEELQKLKDDKKATDDELAEITIKKTRLEAGKARTEELAVSELENVFKKGIEQELMERLDRAKAAADKAMEESAERAKDVDEKQYLELRAKRHKTKDGKIDGKAINEDFVAMKKDSTEYRIEQHPTNPNEVVITEMPPSGWGTTPPPGNEVYYLTGPEFAIIQMMNKTKEFGGKFILGKLKDAEWMKAESQDFATQVLREKMYASRGFFQRRATGVKRLNSSEIAKIKNSTWGSGLLEKALQDNADHVKDMDALMKSDVLQGPGSWKEKIGRLSNKQIALLILALTTGGALLGPVAWAGLTATGSAIGAASLASIATGAKAVGPTVGGAALAGGAAAGAARAGRSRIS